MKTIGKFQFPEAGNREEVDAWKKTFRVRALHHQILCVACTRIEGMWKAYIGPVPGNNHDTEWGTVFGEGSTLPVNVARALFPDFEGIPYAS